MTCEDKKNLHTREGIQKNLLFKRKKYTLS
jgi:hypothetical protein